ncbi:seryl-tRNA synthetase [Polychaeton citri CBS 116435]|uniref:serine--tRNA ligase n=1 Tax=Polychaeton citri CBS 116435 TaxID=1314669 RepID=A0A9P4UQN2_9PEZI|nr:seryl-tRNA synthetase [Polychaeton citri CBS 116435]
MSSPQPWVCTACTRNLQQLQRVRVSNVSPLKRAFTRPSFAPKPTLDLKHIRENPGLYEQNCIDRNYAAQSRNSWRIHELAQQLATQQKEAVDARRKNNALGKEIARQAGMGDDGQGGGAGGISALMEEAKKLKDILNEVEESEKELRDEMEKLALELPNLSSQQTPVGSEPRVLGWINGRTDDERKAVKEAIGGVGGRKSHVDIGKELALLDFEASAATSGWGWYFLKNEAALLEQALIQYALAVAVKRGWKVMTPPSIVYSHIASACGFMPRDQHGETQVYQLAAHHSDSTSAAEERPQLVLAGTAEIPFAGSQASRTLTAADLPLKVIGPSRSYRAEAGARGVDTKGLYRVHEFTKVEMFAWTLPTATVDAENDRFGDSLEGNDDDIAPLPQSEEIFEEMVDMQREILTSLGLHARILEMPTNDLGASATRKIDIETYFPSRTGIDDGYGEVTSASMCTDFQTRRLNTRVKGIDGNSRKLGWPETLNGTAMAVPRILAAVLENGWREKDGIVVVPEVLRKWMPGGIDHIGTRRP